MPLDFQRLMQQAARLTRTGDLRNATAAIQAALRGASQPRQQQPAPPRGDIVLDVEARVLPQQPFETFDREDAPTAPAVNEPGAGDGAGQYVAGSWGGPGNNRDYKLYIPPQAGGRPLPLVVMLHGCTQDPDDFAAGTRMNELARARGCYVLYPAQSRQHNPQGCWNWFKHSHQVRGRGEPALIAGMTRDVMARHAVDPARVYVAGLSAGGAMAAIMGDTYPELYAAVGVHSGLASGSAADLPSALAAMRSGGAGSAAADSGRPTVVFHGDADRTVHPSNGGHVVGASTSAAPAVEAGRGQRPGGRSWTRSVHRAADGRVVAEHWLVHGSGHAWSGGSADGSYTDPQGPDASAEMLRFFLEHPRG